MATNKGKHGYEKSGDKCICIGARRGSEDIFTVVEKVQTKTRRFKP